MDRNVVLVGLAAVALATAFCAVTTGDGLLLRPIRFPARDQKLGRPNDSSSFFSDRNMVRIEVPYAMTANDLISMYKLEQSRPQILQQLGTRDGGSRLAAGRVITVTLTPLIEPIRRGTTR